MSTPKFLGVRSNFRKISFFDESTPSMRNGRDGGKKTGGKKRMMKKVATTSLPAIDRWNAARLCQKEKEEKNVFYSGQ